LPVISVLTDVVVALRTLLTTAEFLISLALLLLLTLAKTTCAYKVADTELMLHTMTSMHINRFWQFLAEMLLR